MGSGTVKCYMGVVLIAQALTLVYIFQAMRQLPAQREYEMASALVQLGELEGKVAVGEEVPLVTRLRAQVEREEAQFNANAKGPLPGTGRTPPRANPTPRDTSADTLQLADHADLLLSHGNAGHEKALNSPVGAPKEGHATQLPPRQPTPAQPQPQPQAAQEEAPRALALGTGNGQSPLDPFEDPSPGAVHFVEDKEWLYPLPKGVEDEHVWRYKSTGLYWTKQDRLFRKFKHYNSTLSLPPPSVQQKIEQVCATLGTSQHGQKLCRMFRKCYPNTLETTTNMLHDGTTYIITGDIPLMWMRDSSAQVHHYLPLAPHDPYIQVIIEGVIRRQIKWIHLDPYGSSYRLFLDFDHAGKKKLTDWDFKSGRTIHVAMHNYEIDSLCYFVKLSYQYWRATGIADIFDDEWKSAAQLIIDTIRKEQDHESSDYRYPELPAQGRGNPVCKCGLSWVGFRPSDDKCEQHYLIPGNMFAVVAMRYISEVAVEVYADVRLKEDALALGTEIDDAIHEHGVVTKNGHQIYAYEVNGCGKTNLMDDANVPSLLSIPYLNYTTRHDPHRELYRNTRNFILSSQNPHFFADASHQGIGSPHTGRGRIWPMSLVMQALTSDDPEEVMRMVEMLRTTDAGTDFMHESFTVGSPNRYTRKWFAWANSLFSELIIKKADLISSHYSK